MVQRASSDFFNYEKFDHSKMQGPDFKTVFSANDNN